MKPLNKLAIAAILASAGVIGSAAPAGAGVNVSVGIGVGGPVFEGDYDYYRPCGWYRYWNLPAPARCYREFWGFYGPSVFIVDGFVFRSHDDWGRWRDRDDWGHWRMHEFRRSDWHDNGLHKGWYKHDGDGDWHDEGRHDHGDGDWHDNDKGHGHGHDHGDWDDHGHGHGH